MSKTLKILFSIALMTLTLNATAMEPARQHKPAYPPADQDNFLLLEAKNKVRLWKSKHHNECEASAKAFR